MVKHLPTVRDTQVRSLGGEDLLEKEMATHSSIIITNNNVGMKLLRFAFQLYNEHFLIFVIDQ